MFDLDRYMLLYAYYYARFSGALNFEIDLRTGRARTTRITTLYSAVTNAITIGLVPWLSSNETIHAFWSRAGDLHEYLFLTILGGRVLCVCYTLFTRWRQRKTFVRLVNAFRLLMLEKPHVRHLCRRGIILKVLGTTFSELLQMVMGLLALWEHLTFFMFLNILMFYTISALVNVVITHYFFAMLLIRGHYLLLNEELRQLLREVGQLETEHRRGVCILRCCALADRLEAIAHTHFRLQALLNQVTGLFGLQTLCMSLSYYMSAISVIYFVFSEARGTTATFEWNYWALAVVSIQFIFYFGDIHISVEVVYDLLDAHAEMVRILSEHIILAPGLDVRLETVLESFKLQLALNPLKISVLQLYNMEKARAAAMSSSVITNSLVLIQHDLKNY